MVLQIFHALPPSAMRVKNGEFTVHVYRCLFLHAIFQLQTAVSDTYLLLHLHVVGFLPAKNPS